MTGQGVPAIGVKDRKHEDVTFLQLEDDTMDPERHYRWVRTDANNSSVTRHKVLGYELETKEGDVKTKATPDNRGDSAITIGDLVLMSCPKEVYDDRVRRKFTMREEILNSTAAETERRAKEKGVKILKDDDSHGET